LPPQTPRWKYVFFVLHDGRRTGCDSRVASEQLRFAVFDINRPTLEKRVFCTARKKQA
jgi:hypothetical protein